MHAVAAQFRLDPLTRQWVNIVGHRQSRPNLPTTDCPFCVGGLEAPEPYDVRWFANRWPALAPGAPIDPDGPLLDGAVTQPVALPAVGACEVVLFSPDHDASLATLPRAQVRKVVDVWAARTEALLARPEVEYVLVFENRGADVGATIDHPHGQIYGYPFVPPAPAREEVVSREHGCAVCTELRAELDDATRIVHVSDSWVAYVPFASTHPYGVRLVARRHTAGLPELDDEQRDGLADALRDVLARYDRFGSASERDFPYLMWFHQAPARGETDAPQHVHAHLAPPQRAPGLARFVASGELGSGTLSNPVVPEDAAAALRDA
jgi:UDPglucose--hexose-1-phosphate uridylyltransferase